MDFRIKAPIYKGITDYTFYCPMKHLKRVFDANGIKKCESRRDWDAAVIATDPRTKAELLGRLNVCRCFAGKYVACTLRATSVIPSGVRINYHVRYRIEGSGYNPNPDRDIAESVRKQIAGRRALNFTLLRKHRRTFVTVNLEHRLLPPRKKTGAADIVRGPRKLGAVVVSMSPRIAEKNGLPPSTRGLLVRSVVADSVAARWGIKTNDVIQKINRKLMNIEGRYLSSMGALCELISTTIFPKVGWDHGLVVVAGATDTGKSRIARGLIYHYLGQVPPKSGGRRPHLVTFENPIDVDWAGDDSAARRTGVDYTPRELDTDVDSPRQAVTAALRQTPKVFFAGETRNPKDWKILLRFATSGHLVITTSHAGSLTEAMGQLFKAAGADTPARRSEVANAVLGLVHLRKENVEGKDEKDLSVTAPAVWCRSSVSTKTLMADGLGSLLPYQGLTPDNVAADFGSLGRSWFANKLLLSLPEPLQKNFAASVRSKVLTWDLEGI